MATMTRERKTITCDRGHANEIVYYWADDLGIPSYYFAKDGPDTTKTVPVNWKQSYAYSHGGCCARAAMDAAGSLWSK